MDQAFLIEFGLVLIVAAGIGVVTRIFKQPLILAYLVAGILIGPFVFNVVKNDELIQNFASIGIIFLLFLIGLELNPRKLLEVGKSAFIIGIAQIVLSGLLYFFVANIFGLSGLGAIYLAAAFTFSSTAIIVTLLSNRQDLDSLHGKILIGVLLIQDFVAIAILTVSSGFQSTSEGLLLSSTVFAIVVKAIVLFALIWLVAKYILPPIFHQIARNTELLFLSSLAWCFLIAIVAQTLGFSAEIGAFLAGISLAPLPFSVHVASKTKPLRDFFLMIFFIYLGTSLVFTGVSTQIVPAIVFAALILFVNPVIIMLTMSILGFRKRTSFITGITLTQVSEFSFIVVALGTKTGVLPEGSLALASIVAIITVFVSTYLISNLNRIYHFLRPSLGFLDSNKSSDYTLNLPEEIEDHVILVGCNRIGSIILETLNRAKQLSIVVDVNPTKIQELIENKQNCIFGDAIDHDIAEHLCVEKAKMLISTIDKFEEDELIIRSYKKLNKNLQTIATANNIEDAKELYNAGADLVIIPTQVSAEYTSHILERLFSGETDLKKLKVKELKELSKGI